MSPLLVDEDDPPEPLLDGVEEAAGVEGFPVVDEVDAVEEAEPLPLLE